MTDPTMLAIASAAAAAIAGKSAESLSEAARQAMGTLVAKIRERFRGSPEDTAILDAIEAEPDAAGHRESLAEALTRLAGDDPAFRDQLMDLAHSAGVRISVQAHTSNVVNAESIGKVVSAGGDINIGGNLSL